MVGWRSVSTLNYLLWCICARYESWTTQAEEKQLLTFAFIFSLKFQKKASKVLCFLHRILRRYFALRLTQYFSFGFCIHNCMWTNSEPSTSELFVINKPPFWPMQPIYLEMRVALCDLAQISTYLQHYTVLRNLPTLTTTVGVSQVGDGVLRCCHWLLHKSWWGRETLRYIPQRCRAELNDVWNKTISEKKPKHRTRRLRWEWD